MIRALNARVGRWLELDERSAEKAARALVVIGVGTLGLSFAKAAQSGLFLGDHDRTRLPAAFFVSAIALALSSLAVIGIAPRLGARKTTRVCLDGASVVGFVLSAALVFGRRNASFAAYVAIEAVSGLLIVQLWAVVSSITDARSARRILPAAGLVSCLAWTASGPLLAPLSHAFGSVSVLASAATLFGLAGRLVDVTGADRPARPGSDFLDDVRDGVAFVVRDPLSRVLTALAMASMVLEQLMDFALLGAAQQTFRDRDAITSFVGGFYSVTSALGVLLLGTTTRRLLERLGSIRSLALLPTIVLVSSVAAFLIPTLATITVMRGLGRILKQSVGSTSVEQLQSPLPSLRRVQARQATRGVLAPIGYAASALGLGAMAHLELRVLAIPIAVVALAMLALVARIVRPTYVRALLAAIDDRRVVLAGRRTSRPDGWIEPDVLSAITRRIEEGDGERATLALHWLARHASALPDVVIAHALVHRTESVRVAAVDALAESGTAESRQLLIAELGREPLGSIRLRRLVAAHAIAAIDAPIVDSLLGDPDEGVRDFCRLLAASSDGSRREALAHAIGHAVPRVRVVALAMLEASDVDDGSIQRILHELLASEDPDSVVAAAEAVVRTGLVRALPTVVSLLAKPAIAGKVARALVALRVDPVARPSGPEKPLLADGLSRIASRIAKTADPVAVESLLARLVEHKDRAIRREATIALGEAIVRGERPPFPVERVAPRIEAVVGTAATLLSARVGLPAEGKPSALFAHELGLEIESLRREVLRLLALLGESDLALAVEVGLRMSTVTRDAHVAELLETSLDERLRAQVVGLFDVLDDRGRLEAFEEAGVEVPREPLDVLLERCGTPYLRVAAVCLGLVDRSAVQENPSMVPVVDRALLLRRVPLFADLSSDDLVHLAESVEERVHDADAIVFREGEPGDSLYVVAAGSCAVERDGAVVARLGVDDVFGDLAVLDHAPRSATIRCLEASRLLLVRGADLEELVANRPAASRALLRVLARRLRNAMSGPPILRDSLSG